MSKKWRVWLALWLRADHEARCSDFRKLRKEYTAPYSTVTTALHHVFSNLVIGFDQHASLSALNVIKPNKYTTSRSLEKFRTNSVFRAFIFWRNPVDSRQLGSFRTYTVFCTPNRRVASTLVCGFREFGTSS